MSRFGRNGRGLTEACMENVYIGISGLIGAGKSTLATALGKVLDLPVYFEPVIDNEYLADFYADMAKYSFPLQVYLLNKRFAQQQQIIWGGKGGIQDRTIYEDAVFARMLKDSGLLDERDYNTYMTLFHNMSNFMTRPNLIVHLDVDPAESLRRIKMRSRGCETGITIEYLTALHAAYESFIRDISLVIPVIRVNYNDFRSAEEMAGRIKIEYNKLRNIRYVEFPASASDSDSPVGISSTSPQSKLRPSALPAKPAGVGSGAGTAESSESRASALSPSAADVRINLTEKLSESEAAAEVSREAQPTSESSE